MVVQSMARYYMVAYSVAGYYMVAHGSPWYYRVLHGSAEYCTTTIGYPAILYRLQCTVPCNTVGYHVVYCSILCTTM